MPADLLTTLLWHIRTSHWCPMRLPRWTPLSATPCWPAGTLLPSQGGQGLFDRRLLFGHHLTCAATGNGRHNRDTKKTAGWNLKLYVADFPRNLICINGQVLRGHWSNACTRGRPPSRAWHPGHGGLHSLRLYLSQAQHITVCQCFYAVRMMLFFSL